MFYINNDLETNKRFDMIKFFNFTDNIDPLNNFMMINIPLLPEVGRITITSQEKRPDLLSYMIYEDTQYWWVILYYNHIQDINQLVSGVIIKYPSKANIEYLYERASILGKTV